MQTLWWFITRPQYIPHVFQILRRNKKTEDTSAEALLWCRQNELSVNQALEKLTESKQCENIQNIFPDIFKDAYNAMLSCPVKMGGEGATSFLYCIAKYIKAQKIIETGVAYGWSSLAILLAIKDDENAKLISNDMPYIKMNNDDYVGCVVPQSLRGKWDLQRLPDVKGIPIAIAKFNNEIDLCHYDSDKSYTGRMFAYPKLWNALKTGGVFISDDIQDNTAFLNFSKNIGRKPLLFKYNDKFVGVIVK